MGTGIDSGGHRGLRSPSVWSLPPAPAVFVSVISVAGTLHRQRQAGSAQRRPSPLVRPRGAGAGGQQAAGHGRRRANHPDLRTPAHPAVTEAHKQGREPATPRPARRPVPPGQARPPSHGRPSSPADGKDAHAMTTSLARRPETGGRSPKAVPAGQATAGYLLPATGRGTTAQAGAALGTLIGPWVALSLCFVLLPSWCPPSAARRVPARMAAATTPGRSGPGLVREGETSP
jgi:hypothetical protein